MLACSASLACPASAGTYSFALDTRTLATHLATLHRPAPPGRLDSALGYSTRTPWDGPEIVASSPGQHTAWSSSYLSLVAPSGTSFVGASTVVSYSACAADAGAWFAQAELKAGSQFKVIRRDNLAKGACVTVPAQSPSGASPAGATELRFELQDTAAATAQAKGTYLAVHAVSGALDDPIAPTVTVSVDPAAVHWAIADGQSGPRSALLDVSGPAGYHASATLWSGTTQLRSCLTGQWIAGCGTSTSGARSVALPPVTGDYTFSVTGADGAGNRSVVSRVLAFVAAPAMLAPPSLSGIAVAGQTLRAASGTWSNQPTTRDFTFLRDDSGTLVVIAGPSSAATYVLARADVGHAIVVRETVANAAGSTSALSAAVGPVLPLPPASGTPALTGGPARVDVPLGVVQGDWDNGGAPGQPALAAITWRTCVDATCVQRASGVATFTPLESDVGAIVEVAVQVANAGGTGTAIVRSEPVVASPPSLASPPAVIGIARAGDLLQADPARWTTHGAGVTTARAWLSCSPATPATCVELQAGDTYRVDPALVGQLLRVRESAAWSGGTQVALSAPTQPVLARGECIEYRPGALRACVGASVVSLAGQVVTPRVLSGESTFVTGSVSLAGTITVPTTVTVRFTSDDPGNRFGAAQAVRLSAAGLYAARFVPVVSGRYTVELAVEGRQSALRLEVGGVRVKPRISARFTARRDLYGRLRDLRVSGAVAPGVSLPGLRLLIEARLPNGRVVGLICRIGEQPVVTGGRYSARCASRGLPAKARYRVLYTAGPGSPLDPTATGWSRARLRK